MMSERKNIHFPTLFKSLLAGWVFIVFGTSLMIHFILPPIHEDFHENSVLNFLITIWEIADEIGPIVKLSIIAIFSLLLLILRKAVFKSSHNMYIYSGLLALASLLFVLLLLPMEYSRGFGIGISKNRIWNEMLPFYVLMGFSGGLVFATVYQRLLSKRNT